MAHQHTDAFDSMPAPSQELESWIAAFKAEPRVWRARFNKLWASMRAWTPSEPGPQVADAGGAVPCPHCNMVFSDNTRMLCHAATRHGYVNPMKQRLHSSCCACCGWEFHTKTRLLKHLRRMKGNSNCARMYSQFVPPMSSDELEQVEREKKCPKSIQIPAIPRVILLPH